MAVSVTAAARVYAGSGYVYDGPGWPPGNWDCSSFMSEVTGRQLGLGLPGGGRWGSPGYPPSSHGPDVNDYAAHWTVPAAAGTPGAAVIWAGAGPNGHIGICLGPNQMISALNPNYGTAITPVDGYGPAGASPVYRVITGAAGGPGQASPGAPGTDVVSLWSQVFPSVPWKDAALAGVAVVAVLAAALAATGVLWASVTVAAAYAASRAAR
jgi:NlpC/P60 family